MAIAEIGATLMLLVPPSIVALRQEATTPEAEVWVAPASLGILMESTAMPQLAATTCGHQLPQLVAVTKMRALATTDPSSPTVFWPLSALKWNG